MAFSNRSPWFRWPLRRTAPDPPVTYFGSASSYTEREMEARRHSPEWPELGGAATPPNPPRQDQAGAESRHRPGNGHRYA